MDIQKLLQNRSPLEKWLFVVGCTLMGYGFVNLAMHRWPHLVTFPRLSVVFGFLCIVIAFLMRFTQGTGNDKTWLLLKNHEERSKNRYCDAQDRLDKYFVNVTDDDSLKKLTAKLDAQLKLEDYLLRFREADHASVKVWGTVFTAGIVSLIVAFLTSHK